MYYVFKRELVILFVSLFAARFYSVEKFRGGCTLGPLRVGSVSWYVNKSETINSDETSHIHHKTCFSLAFKNPLYARTRGQTTNSALLLRILTCWRIYLHCANYLSLSKSTYGTYSFYITEIRPTRIHT